MKFFDKLWWFWLLWRFERLATALLATAFAVLLRRAWASKVSTLGVSEGISHGLETPRTAQTMALVKVRVNSKPQKYGASKQYIRILLFCTGIDPRWHLPTQIAKKKQENIKDLIIMIREKIEKRATKQASQDPSREHYSMIRNKRHQPNTINNKPKPKSLSKTY